MQQQKNNINTRRNYIKREIDKKRTCYVIISNESFSTSERGWLLLLELEYMLRDLHRILFPVYT